MILSIEVQFKIFIFGILAGIITGNIFDIYSSFTDDKKNNKVIIFLEDILFSIFTALLVYIFLLYFKYAYIKGYIYLYIILGVFIYYRFLRIVLTKITQVLFLNIGKFIRIFIKNLWFSLNLLILLVKRKK